MTLIFRWLTLAVVAGLGLTFASTVKSAVIQPRAPGSAVAAVATLHPGAGRSANLRYDGHSTSEWAAVQAAVDTQFTLQSHAEFSAKLDTAIVEMTPPPPPPAPAPVAQPVLAARVATPAPPAAPAAYSGSVPDLIRSVFAAGGQAAVDWALRVAKCESGFNPNAYNASSGASGVFQFLPSTWHGSPYASSSPFDAAANVRAALWLYQRSGPTQWSCT